MTTEHETKPVEHRGRRIEREIRIQAPAERVWEAWADPVRFSQWFVERAEGYAKPGATITWFFDAFHFQISYQVLGAEPGRSYVIRWDPVAGHEAGILEVTLSQQGGVTTLRLVQSGFREGAEWDAEYEGVSSGWIMALALVKHYAEKYFAQPRATWMLMRPAAFTAEQVAPLERTEAGLARWLTRSGALPAAGERFQLALQSGETLSGQVLALSKSETCLSWDEVHGTLEFKAFAMGPQKMVGLRASAWAGGAARLEAAKPAMEAALDRWAAILAAK
jgi:uncharacterized protein YndB with AHSA1/START domain